MNLFASLLVALVVVMLLTQAATQPDVICMSSETREKIRELMLSGIDKGMEAHTVHMFDVWMRDPAAQPKRARTGMKNAAEAYVGSREAVSKWNPPVCAGPNQ